MITYNLSIILMLILSIFFKKIRNGKKFFLIIATLWLITLSTFKDISVGTDTLNYINHFDNIKYMTLQHMFNDRVEFGYNLLNKLIIITFNNYQFLFFIVSLLIFIPISIIIYKKSPRVGLSYHLYYTLGYLGLSLCLLRQSIAMSICLFSIKYIEERNFKKFIIIILIASLFQKTVLIFVLLYFIAYQKINTKYIVSLLSLFFILFIIKKPLIYFFTDTFLPPYYKTMLVDNNSYTFMLLIIIVFIIALIYKNIVLIKYPKAIIFYNSLVLAIFSQLLGTVVDNFNRITYMFYLPVIFLLPMIVNCISDKNMRFLALVAIYVLSFLQFLLLTPDNAVGIVPYNFFDF